MENYKKAIDLLKQVLLQNDEKDELQLSIEKFLMDIGELKSEVGESKLVIYYSMTKKEFKARVNDQTYTGWNGHRTKKYAYFFDWKSGVTVDNKYFGGYKYMVVADYKDVKKPELFDYFYWWITGKIKGDLPYYIHYKFAETDEQRFKVPLTM